MSAPAPTDRPWSSVRRLWPEWLRREKPQLPVGLSAYGLFRSGAIRRVPRLPDGAEGP